MTRRVALALVLVWACCFGTANAGEIAYDMPSKPVASDSAYCGAADLPCTDFDHYLVNLYRAEAATPFASFNLPADTDSVRFTVSDGIQGRTQVWAVDTSGNVSCNYASHVWAVPAVAEPPPPPPDTTSGGIMGHYYSGQSMNTFVADRRDSTIDFAWGSGSPMPGMPADGWSVQWVGKLVIATPGAYTLYLASQDGGRLYINNGLYIDKWVAQPLTEWSATVNLAAGEHNLVVEYTARVGNSECHLMYSGPSISKRVVPKGVLR